MIASPTPPTLRSLLATFKQEVFEDLNCHAVGTITAFNATLQTASVQLSIPRVVNGKVIPYPLLTDCPVFVPSGGGAALTFPIAAGDPCLVLFNDRDLDNWFTTGNMTPPNSNRMHSLSDGLVLVGVRNKASPPLVSGSRPTLNGPGLDILGGAQVGTNLNVSGNAQVGSGATGLFTSSDGATVTVVDGIVINIAR